jgi:Protein of unknown function (DUF3175)
MSMLDFYINRAGDKLSSSSAPSSIRPSWLRQSFGR